MGDFKKLDVWQRAHALGLAVYRACASFPRSEQYGLASQMRTAVVSIAANVVEGSGRLGHREFQRFLRISLGSAAKLECYLLLGHDLQFLDDASFGDLGTQLHVVRGMLVKLQRTVSRDAARISAPSP